MSDIETTAGVSCASCGRQSRSRRGWSPVIRKGETVGATCPSCPRAGTSGEPIRRVVATRTVTDEHGRRGEVESVRYRVTLDAGTDPRTGRRIQASKFLGSLADARKWARERAAQIAAEREAGRAAVAPDRMTVNALCDAWLEWRRSDPDLRENTRETYAHALKPVRRHLGSRQVQKLTARDVRELGAWLAREGGKRGQGLGHHAISTALATFRQVLDYGVEEAGVVPENVARKKAARTKTRRRTSPSATAQGHGPGVEVLERWTAPELVAFTKHADTGEHAAAWRLSTLGLRREEVLGLTWDAVDFDTGEVHIRQSRVAVSRATDPRGWIVGEPKSHDSWRTIRPDDVQPGTMTMLKGLRLASVTNPEANPSGLVVVDALGEPVGPKSYSVRFTVLCRGAGVPVIHLHSTRHTLAYLFHVNGVPPANAAKFLGHTLPVYMAIYLKGTREGQDAAGVVLGQALVKAAAGS